MNDIRENIQSLIDYCGDCKRNGGNIRSATYSKEYSPNNIKTLVISVEGVLVRLHRPFTGALPKGCIRLSSQVYYYMFTPFRLYKEDERGKMDLSISIFKMLVRPLVCASIEEIVILQGVSNEQYYRYVNIMESFEANYNDLLIGYGGRCGDLSKDLANRFVRLYKIERCSLNFVQFIDMYRRYEAMQSSYFFDNALESCTISHEVYNEEWYNGIKLLPQTYFLDNNLKGYFDGIKSKYAKEAKKSKVEDMYKKDMVGLDKAIEKYTALCLVPIKMRGIVQSGKSNGVVDGLTYPSVPYNKLLEYPGFPKGIKDIFVDSETKCSTKDAIKHNKEAVTQASKLVTLASKALIEGLNSIYADYPVTFRTIVDKIKELVSDNTVRIIVPPDCKRYLAEMEEGLSGLKFECDAKRLSQSIVTATWLYCVCFIEMDASTSKYKDMSTWSAMVSKKGAKR